MHLFCLQANTLGVHLNFLGEDHIPIDMSSVFVNIDTNKMGQVFRNLISNALKFTPSGGRVDVYVTDAGGAMTLHQEAADECASVSDMDPDEWRTDNCICISVHDTGSGLSKVNAINAGIVSGSVF